MGLFDFRKKDEIEKAEERAVNAGKNEFAAEGKGAELLAAIFGGGKITGETAMEIPAVSRCVHMAAQAAAMLPVKLYKKSENGIEEVAGDRRIEMLNGDSGDSIPGAYMRYKWVCDLLLWGAAYGFIEREKGIAARVFYVSPKDISVLKDGGDIIHKNYRYSVRGKIYYPFEFLKILRCTDGFGKGRGLVAENPLVIDTAYRLLKFQRNLLAKGGAKKGFLQTEKTVSDKSIEEIKNNWRNLYSGENVDNVIFLNSGVGFKEISSSSVEMQINENMRTVNGEILRLFGSESGMLDEKTVKNAVMPILDMMETAFDSDLLTEEEKGRFYFAFDTKELTRGDISARFGAYAVALEKGFMQIDEVRALEDLPPTGMEFMKLSQADVLYDPATKRIYTLNSNKWAVFGDGEFEDVEGEKAPGKDIPEEVRGNGQNCIQLDDGHMDGSTPADNSSESSEKGLTNTPKNGKIDSEESRKLLREAIDSGKVSTKLDKKAQSKHVKNSDAYNAEIAKGEMPSYMTISKMEIQRIINNESGNGDIRFDGNQFREVITVNENVAMFGDKLNNQYIATNRATIHYSKHGTHLVPAPPKKEK